MPRTAQRQREHAPIFRIFTAAIYNIAMIQQTDFTLRPRTRGFHLVTAEIAANLPPLPAAGPCRRPSVPPSGRKCSRGSGN